MRSGHVRLITAAAGVLPLLGGIVPPVHATTVWAADFVGTITLATPLGYPCTGPAGYFGTTTVGTLDSGLCPTNKVNTTFTPSPNLLTLPGSLGATAAHLLNDSNRNEFISHLLRGTPVLTQNSLPLPTSDLVPNPPFWPDLHHNRTTITGISLTVCIVVAVNNKPGKPLVHPNFGCSATATVGTLPNTVAGNCGVSSGQVTVLFNDGLGQTFRLDLHFFVVGGRLFIEGHSVKLTGGQTGLVLGLAEAIPPTLVLTGGGGSCLAKTATVFTFAGIVGGGGV